MTHYQYFIDSDPGYGNAVPIAFYGSADVNAVFTADLSDLEIGHHILYIRGQDDMGDWSLSLARPFYKSKLTDTDGYSIVRLEYYIDDDPGYGSGISVPFTPGSNVSADFTVDLTGIPLGFHTLYIRAQDEFGEWSPVRAEEIEVMNDFAFNGNFPLTVINSGSATVSLRGPIVSGYSRVKLAASDGTEIFPTGIFRMSSTELAASFDMNGAAAGIYSVTVYENGKPASTLANAVIVTADGTEGHLRVTASPTEFVRPSRQYTCWIEYENDGSTDLSAPLLVISNSANARMRLSEDEPFQDGPLQILGVNLKGPAGQGCSILRLIF